MQPGGATTRYRRTRWAALGAATAIATGALIVTLNGADAAGDDPLSYNATTPCRLIDTRPDTQFNTGPRNTPLGPADTFTITARGAQGKCSADQLPTDAQALALNITVPSATANGFLTIWPDGTRPDASSLNPAPGQPPVPNAVTTPLSTTGTFNVFNNAGNTHLIIDVVGHYTPATSGPPGPTGPAGPAGADGTDLYERTIVVPAGGTPTENGAAFVAAVAQVDAPSATKPWTIELDAGVFDVGDTEVELPDHTSLRGAGVEATKIVGQDQTLLLTGDGAGLSDFWIETSGIAPTVKLGPDSGAVGAVVHDLRITNTLSDGMWISTNEAMIRNVDIDAGDDAANVNSSTGVEIRNSVLRSYNTAVRLLGDPSDVLITHTELDSFGGGPPAVFFNSDGHTLEITHSTLRSVGGESVSGSTSTGLTLNLFQSHIDVDQPIDFDAGNGTATCAALSSEAGLSSKCI